METVQMSHRNTHRDTQCHTKGLYKPSKIWH